MRKRQTRKRKSNHQQRIRGGNNTETFTHFTEMFMKILNLMYGYGNPNDELFKEKFNYIVRRIDNLKYFSQQINLDLDERFKASKDSAQERQNKFALIAHINSPDLTQEQRNSYQHQYKREYPELPGISLNKYIGFMNDVYIEFRNLFINPIYTIVRDSGYRYSFGRCPIDDIYINLFDNNMNSEELRDEFFVHTFHMQKMERDGVIYYVYVGR